MELTRHSGDDNQGWVLHARISIVTHQTVEEAGNAFNQVILHSYQYAMIQNMHAPLYDVLDDQRASTSKHRRSK